MGSSSTRPLQAAPAATAVPGPRQRHAALLLAAVLLAAAAWTAGAQQLTPFQGRNAPLDGTTDVFVSAVVDHLVAVDDASYRFEVVLYLQLTWNDPRARAAITNATQRSRQPDYNNGNGCAFPCTTIYAWSADPQAQSLCCDDVWLPHFEFINVRGFSQDRVVRYGVRVPNNTSDPAVAWWVHLQGDFYTPLTFRAFPFDKQFLSVQVQYGNKFPNSTIRIIPSASGTQLYSPETGDKLSGWTLEALHITTFNLFQQDLIQSGSGSTYSDPADPWPLHPSDPAVQAFTGYLWQNGFELYIEVHRIAAFYIITAILPIYINTCLALLVFSVSPRHLDTRLGIVVTLFLSLTALQFIIAAQLPSSATVVPTQQLIIVSYCILGGIGICSIIVFWMVSLHRTRERKRRLKRAKRAFTSRWHSVTSSMGLAVAAAAAVGEQRGQGNCSTGGGSGGGAGGVSVTRRRATTQTEERRVSWLHTGAAAIAVPPVATLPPSPFQAAQQPAAADTAGRGPSAPTAEGKPPNSRGSQQLALLSGGQPTSSQGRPQLLQSAGTMEGPQVGGMGIFAGGDNSTGPSSGEDPSSARGSGSDSGDSFHSRRSTGRAAGAAAKTAAAPVQALDEEEGGALPAWWRRWQRRFSCGICCSPSAPGSKGDSSGAGNPGWLRLQSYKFRLMTEEMRNSSDYAVYVAHRIDKYIFWTTLAGFNLAVILIFAIQSQYNPQPLLP